MSGVIRDSLPGVWDAVFPQSSMSDCPTAATSIALSRLPIPVSPALAAAALDVLGHNPASAFTKGGAVFPVRLPFLILVELGGIFVGVQGFTMFASELWAWRRAFLLFAGMNLSALFCHNLTAAGSDPYWFAWALDVAFTGR